MNQKPISQKQNQQYLKKNKTKIYLKKQNQTPKNNKIKLNNNNLILLIYNGKLKMYFNL